MIAILVVLVSTILSVITSKRWEPKREDCLIVLQLASSELVQSGSEKPVGRMRSA